MVEFAQLPQEINALIKQYNKVYISENVKESIQRNVDNTEYDKTMTKFITDKYIFRTSTFRQLLII